jgi:hypothetical protein
LALLGLIAGSASAAQVVNGGFESGTLEGWHISAQTGNGGWYAISGTTGPRSNDVVAPPFAGNFNALADEEEPDSMVLYQDVALTPGVPHQLSLELNYVTDASIAIPEPDTLNANGTDEEGGDEQPNQQVRVDVLKPGSPVRSLAPSDILETVFATSEGDPSGLDWTPLSADLSAFGGQTVRIRIADVNNQGNLLVGVDDVSISGEKAPVEEEAPVAPPTVTPASAPVAPAPAPAAVKVFCTVPKLKGKKLKAAKKKIRAAHCKVGRVTRKKRTSAKTARVVHQSPKPGKIRRAGSKVNLKLG